MPMQACQSKTLLWILSEFLSVNWIWFFFAFVSMEIFRLYICIIIPIGQCHDIAEILLMLALNTNQSINQPIESLPHTVRVYNPVLMYNKQTKPCLSQTL